ncbi:F-box/LRR-repeat protein At5g02910-like [Rutidosis leptorrhynchoides]|uniref:F-box/LRR-repeat protein At5g02910-like n=1 Tax=Rutidosis leptorrhynchoides TaxID=125765 RepID=UPI003A98ECB8
MSDDVLVLILALIPMKDVVATSSVAKRWRYVWRNLRRLNFYGPETFRNGVRVTNEDESEREKYINQLEFAIQRKVEFLELNLLFMRDHYDFPSRCFHTEVALPYLKKLILKNVNLTKEIFHEVLKQSPLLVMVSIHYLQDLVHIQVDEQARNLKRFEIVGNFHLKSVCLSNLDLVSFTCKGFHIDIRLAHISKLKELELDFCFSSINNVFNQISACALSLQYLSISVDEPLVSVSLFKCV